MPYKSRAQEKYMNWSAAHGKIKQSIVDEFNRASKGMKLPEHVKKKKKYQGSHHVVPVSIG